MTLLQIYTGHTGKKKKKKNPIKTFIFIKQDKGLWDHRPTTVTSNGIKKFRETHLKGTHYEPCDLISHKTKLQCFITVGPISIKQCNLMQCYFFVSFLNVFFFFFIAHRLLKCLAPFSLFYADCQISLNILNVSLTLKPL